jgi:hypothetical protein
MHNEEGPAYDDKKGNKEWHLFGEQVTEAEFKLRVAALQRERANNGGTSLCEAAEVFDRGSPAGATTAVLKFKGPPGPGTGPGA